MFDARAENSALVKERRMFDRFVARLPIKLSASEQNFTNDILLRDISAGGARLVTTQRPIPREDINFWVQIPDGRDPLHLKGKVVWAQETGLDIWDAGVSFEKIRLMDLHRVFNL